MKPLTWITHGRSVDVDVSATVCVSERLHKNTDKANSNIGKNMDIFNYSCVAICAVIMCSGLSNRTVCYIRICRESLIFFSSLRLYCHFGQHCVLVDRQHGPVIIIVIIQSTGVFELHMDMHTCI